MSEPEPFNAPRILGPNGKPPEKATDPDRCPQCHAGRDRRRNASGFGPATIVCGACGYHYEGTTE